ncbi:unnamed protein product [Closterium sp. NIES-54]
MAAAKRVLRYLCSMSGMGLVLGGRSPVVLTGHADTSRYEAEIYAGAMAAQELRWLTYLLTDLGEPPRSPPVLTRQHRTAQALYNAVVARYSLPATAALGRLLLPYLFCELTAFATVEDLVSNLRTSDARDRAALPAEFLDRNPPPMYITLYFIVTRLPDSLRVVRDHFLALDPTTLTVHLLEQHLLAAETSVVSVGAARGTPRTPFFEGCSPSPLAPSYTSAAAVDVLGAEDVGAASASVKRRSSKSKGGRSGGGGSGGGSGGSSGVGGGSVGGGSGGSGGGSGGFGGGGGGSGGSGGGGSGGSGGGRTGAPRGGSGRGQRQQQKCRSKTPSPQQLREWFAQRGASEGSVSCPYVIRTGDCAGQTCGKLHSQHHCFSHLDDAWRAEFGDKAESPRWADLLRYGVAIFDLCVLPDPGIEATALGASESVLPCTAPAEALHTFTLDSGASRSFFRDSTTLTPLSAPVPVRLADPSRGPVLARSSTVFPCLAVLTGSLSGLHLPSFSTNLVSTAALQDVMPPLLISPCVAPDSSVAPPPGSPLPATPLWHALPSPCLWSSQVFASPPALACPALPSLRQGAAARRSSLLLVSPDDCSPAHLDVWGPARVSGPVRERYFLLSISSSASGSARTFLSYVFTLSEMVSSLRPLAEVLSWGGHSQVDVTFDESVPIYRLFPYRSAPPQPPPLFLAPGPPPVDPLPPQGPAPSGVSQVDPLPSTAPVEVAVGSGAARGDASKGAEPGGAEPGDAESEGARFGGAEPGGAESGGAEPAGVEPRGAEPEGVESRGAEPQCTTSSGGLAVGDSATGDTGAGGAGVTAGAGGLGGAAAADPGALRTRGSGAAGTGGVGGARAGDPTEPGGAGAGGTGTGGAGT